MLDVFKLFESKSKKFSFERRNLKTAFPSFEKRKNFLKKILNFRKKKEKWILFSQASRREREF